MTCKGFQFTRRNADNSKRSCSISVLVFFAVNLPLLIAVSVFLPYDYYRELDDAIQSRQVSLDAQALTIFQGLSVPSEDHTQESIQEFIDAACNELHNSKLPDRHIAVRWNDRLYFAEGHRSDSSRHCESSLESYGRSDDNSVSLTTPSLIVGKFLTGGSGVYISENTSFLRQSMFDELLVHLGFLAALGCTAVLIVNIVLWRIIVRPIKQLSDNVARITDGDFDIDSCDNQSREIQQLAGSIRQMANTLAANEISRASQMERARRIQEHLLPVGIQVPGLDVASIFQPAETVAGDYYDLIDLSDGTWLICVADVMGHGVPAAMGSAMLKALLMHATEHFHDPKHILEFVNSKLPELLPEGFITMFVSRWAPDTQTLTFANAGHDPGLLLQDESLIKELMPSGMPLGIAREEKWTNETIRLESGSRLLLTTDGVSEASNPHQVEFGRDKLKAMLSDGKSLSPNEFVESIRDAVASHQQGRPIQDDVTILLLENTINGELERAA